MRPAATALILCFIVGGVHAQPVYRCGSEYSQTPCPQGKIVEATDPRSAAQRAEGRRVAADERQLAADMRKDRLAEEAALKPASAGSLSAARPAAPSEAAGSKKQKKRSSAQPARSNDFVVTVASGKKQRARQ